MFSSIRLGGEHNYEHKHGVYQYQIQEWGRSGLLVSWVVVTEIIKLIRIIIYLLTAFFSIIAIISNHPQII